PDELRHKVVQLAPPRDDETLYVSPRIGHLSNFAGDPARPVALSFGPPASPLPAPYRMHLYRTPGSIVSGGWAWDGFRVGPDDQDPRIESAFIQLRAADTARAVVL